MTKFDWYRRNPSKFFGGTVGLKWETKAVYGLVLDLIYDARGKLEDDPGRIVHYLGVGMSKQRWNTIRAELIGLGKLVLKDGFLTNPKADRELSTPGNESGLLQKTHAKIPRKISPKSPAKVGESPEIIGQKIPPKIPPVFEGGSNENKDLTLFPPPKTASMPARARENPESRSQSQTDGPTEADVIVQVEQIATVLGQQRGRYWEADYRRMIQSGLTFEDVLEAAQAHRGEPIRNMRALEGLARKIGRDRGSPPPVSKRAIQLSDRDWGIHLNAWVTKGLWSRDDLGPKPNEPNCNAPADMLALTLEKWIEQGSHPTLVWCDLAMEFVPWGSARKPIFVDPTIQ